MKTAIEMEKEISELYQMCLNQAATIKKYQDAVKAEREACAKICEEYGAYTTKQVAATIRARSNDE